MASNPHTSAGNTPRQSLRESALQPHPMFAGRRLSRSRERTRGADSHHESLRVDPPSRSRELTRVRETAAGQQTMTDAGGNSQQVTHPPRNAEGNFLQGQVDSQSRGPSAEQHLQDKQCLHQVTILTYFENFNNPCL